MLFTRCPDCDTTFRVTDDALNKAHGQVRCGRCASVFNAYAERRDGPDEPAATVEPDTGSAGTAPSGALPGDASDHPLPNPLSHAPLPSVKISNVTHSPGREHFPDEAVAAAPSVAPATAATPATFATLASSATTSDATTPGNDAFAFAMPSLAQIVAQVEIGVADENAVTGELGLESAADDEGISASQVQQVLESDGEPPSWALLDTPEPRTRTGLWTAATVLAIVVLAVQSVHHYRSQLVTNTAVGPLVQRTYAMLGTTVMPHWDIRQYDILDWIATAEPSTRGRGNLRITARIKNLGPQYQPYPSVQLRLKDRWEKTVGSRVFAPAEYLAAAPRKLMAPGETTRAELAVVDPGQDAYGFELDVCIEIETHVLSCGSDKVFL